MEVWDVRDGSEFIVSDVGHKTWSWLACVHTGRHLPVSETTDVWVVPAPVIWAIKFNSDLKFRDVLRAALLHAIMKHNLCWESSRPLARIL